MQIACITGSRADKANLSPVIKALNARWICIDPNPSASPISSALATSQAITETTHKLQQGPVDLVFLLGDRFEILGAATAANILGIPIAHLSGGDLTEGSQDDCFRHAITKLSHLHFATNKESAKRIVQMGEEPSRVHNVGCPGVDRLMATKLMEREKALFGYNWDEFIVVCLHPNTLSDSQRELNAMVTALDQMRKDIGVILIGPNNDAGSQAITSCWRALWAERADKKNLVYCPSLETERYFSLMMYCNAFVGNSSAGLYEAPSFGTPVINIGDRQCGRIRAPCVVDVGADPREILMALKQALKTGHMAPRNPYGDGHACERIVKIVSEITKPKQLLRKRFYHVGSRVGKGTQEPSMGIVPGTGDGVIHNATDWFDGPWEVTDFGNWMWDGCPTRMAGQ